MSLIDRESAESQEYWNAAPWNDFTEAELRDFLAELKNTVPVVKIQNGLEYYKDYAPPDHPKVKNDIIMKNAAELLYHREIEARIDLNAEGTVDWRDNERVDSRYFADPLAVENSGVETGPLSYDDHAKRYFDFVLSINTMIATLEGLVENPVLREQIRTYCHSMGMAGFNAGVHYRAALGKQIEPSALTGLKVNKANTDRRDKYNRAKKKQVDARREIIRGLLSQTDLKGGALIKWLCKKLEKQTPSIKLSARTIRADLKALGELGKKVGSAS